MKIAKWFLMFVPVFGYAHCPIPMDVNGEALCAEVEWLEGERKVRGEFESVNYKSPQLILKGEVPQRWVYSKMNIRIWENGDRTHTLRSIEGLRVFPYMFMENGHHHSASYEFFWDSAQELYVLKGVGFQQMSGCWSLRWTTSAQDELASSHVFQTMNRFENLNAGENDSIKTYCEALPIGDGHDHDHGDGHGHDHDHGHHHGH